MNIKKSTYWTFLVLFFIIQFFFFFTSQLAIYDTYFYRIHYDDNWGWAVFTITIYSFIHWLFSLLIDFTIQRDNQKTKSLLITNIFPLLIWFNYESITFCVSLGFTTLIGMIFWYYLSLSKLIKERNNNPK